MQLNLRLLRYTACECGVRGGRESSQGDDVCLRAGTQIGGGKAKR